MIMLTKTHKARMDREVQRHDSTYKALILEVQERGAAERKLAAETAEVSRLTRELADTKRTLVASQLEVYALLDMQFLFRHYWRKPDSLPFKWGAEPAPEAQRAAMVDRMCQAYGCTVATGTGDPDKRPYSERPTRYPYAGTANHGRMPGAGSVQP